MRSNDDIVLLPGELLPVLVDNDFIVDKTDYIRGKWGKAFHHRITQNKQPTFKTSDLSKKVGKLEKVTVGTTMKNKEEWRKGRYD